MNQTKKSSNPHIGNDNVGINRPSSQISIHTSTNNFNNRRNINQNQRNINHKKQNSLFDNSKLKINKSQSKKDKKKTYNNNLNPKDKKNLSQNNKKINKNSQENINNKKYIESKTEIKNNNIKLEDKNKFIVNNFENEIIKSLGKNDNFINLENKDELQYFNTEISSNIINTIYSKHNPEYFCKVYENCLLKGNNKNSETKFNNEIKIGNEILNLKEDKNLIPHSSSCSKTINNVNFPFMKKNIYQKNNIRNNVKMNLNLQLNNLINNININEYNPYVQRYKTNSFNNKLYDLIDNNTSVEYIFNYWNNSITKKRILKIFLNRIKINIYIKKSQLIINNRIIKILNYCILNKYFNIYKNIIFKKKILKNLKNVKKNVIKCINISIRQKNGYDIINNININNYINYPDLNKIIKKRSQSPIVLSKLYMFTKEKNYYNENNIFDDLNSNGNIFNEQNKNINFNNNINNINYNDNFNNYYNSIPFNQTDRINNNIFNPENSFSQKISNKKKLYLNNINLNNSKNNIINKENENNINNKYCTDDKLEKTYNKKNLINQVNQLRMVFNLLEQHENKNSSLYECFNKWLFETKIVHKLKSKDLFWSFSGNINYNKTEDNYPFYKKYSVNTYKEKDINNAFPLKNNYNINSIEIGKYTPVRGIKSFRSKTSQKISNTQQIFEYNDMNDIINNNFNIFNKSSSLMNNVINNNTMNMVYHKKKLIYPNNLNNNCFLEYNNMNNNSYLTNIDNNISMNYSNYNFYKKENNQDYQDKNNNEINNSNNTVYIDNYNKGNFIINEYKTSTYIQPNIVQEKKLDINKINRIEEKEINFAFYKRNKSYNKILNININPTSNKVNNEANIFNENIIKNNLNEQNIKIIYKKGKNLINSFSNINYKQRNKNNQANSESLNIKNETNKKENINKHIRKSKSGILMNKYRIEYDIECNKTKKLNCSFSYMKIKH